MIAAATTPRTSLTLLEGGLTLVVIAISFCFPHVASTAFKKVESFFSGLARRPRLSVAFAGAAALLLRIAILPLCPAPHPFVPDDFSFLLAAHTFASGRLANPTPPMWVHFESIHITMAPTYMSMYFPAQGLFLAAGEVLTGHAWSGVLFSSALMCAALCWMLQGWLPASWALLGGFFAVLRLGLFSYWINTYSGGGLIAAAGGALVLGALPRVKRNPASRYFFIMGLGACLLATSRPYEGILLCVPVAISLIRWARTRGGQYGAKALCLRAGLGSALVVVAICWMGYYDYRAFGNALTPPYKVDRATYAVAPYYIWQKPRPEPLYRHAVMRHFYYQNELTEYQKVHRPSGFLPYTLGKGVIALLFFAGIALLPPLIMVRRLWLDRRVRFLVICVCFLIVGMAIEVFMIPHYLAPFTAAFYALGLQAMRHLRVWRPGGQPVGRTMVRLITSVCILLGAVRAFPLTFHLDIPEWPPSVWIDRWYGPLPFGTERAGVESTLGNMAGGQLAIVRYAPNHNVIDEWVYNAPDIDHSKVIWAREMSAAENLELIRYYKDRTVWLVQPDLHPVGIAPYPIPAAGAIESASTTAAPAR
jgi:hypothetical protein